jgi:hypothetical protein
MSALRQAPLIGRRALGALVALLLLLAIVVTFSGTLTRSTDVEARAQQARALVAETRERLAAGEKELAFVQTDDFIRWQAAAIGFGEKGWQPFALEDAPPPARITPIGPQDPSADAQAPFDAWMELLFGA